MDVKKHLDLTKTKAAKQQRREDDTSFILCTAVNSDDSLERKKRKKTNSRGGDLHGEREREGAQRWFWFIFMVYLCTSQWFPPPNPR